MNQEQIEIRRARARAWAAAHPERVQKNKELYYLKNRERLLKQSADYASKHPEPNRERQREWRVKYPWYNSWQCARQRCTNPKNPRYAFYGGKGIKFLLTKADVAFLWTRDRADLMSDPTIDRRDSDGDYVMDNCRFIERWENSKIAALRRCRGLEFL